MLQVELVDRPGAQLVGRQLEIRVESFLGFFSFSHLESSEVGHHLEDSSSQNCDPVALGAVAVRSC